LSLIYNELFKENNRKVYRSEVLDVMNDKYNFFNMVYTLSPTLIAEIDYNNKFSGISTTSEIINGVVGRCKTQFFNVEAKASTVYG
jgi:hypothetical protein